MPGLDIIAPPSAMIGFPGASVVGWTEHFTIGAVVGILFMLLHPYLPGGGTVLKGRMK